MYVECTHWNAPIVLLLNQAVQHRSTSDLWMPTVARSRLCSNAKPDAKDSRSSVARIVMKNTASH